MVTYQCLYWNLILKMIDFKYFAFVFTVVNDYEKEYNLNTYHL